MTSAGPEPGWYFDPDGGDNDRYWNGEAWSEHRRPRSPTSNTRPAQAPDTANPVVRIADEPTAEPSPSRTAPASATDAQSVQPSSPPEALPGQQGDEDAGSPPADPRLPAAPQANTDEGTIPHPASASPSLPTQLHVGGLAKIVVADKRYKGQVGRVVAFTSRHVDLKIKGAIGTLSFGRHDVIAVEDETQRGQGLMANDAPLPAGGAQISGLNVGGLARIVAKDKRYQDRIGQVVALDAKAVTLKIKGTVGTFDFRREHVVAVEDANGPRRGSASTEGTRAVTAPPSLARRTATEPGMGEGFDGSHGFEAGSPAPPLPRSWAGLPTGGRIAIVAVPVAVIVATIAIAAGCSSGSSTSSGSSISGSLNDWIGALCPSGRATSQIIFPGSQGGGTCIPGGSSSHVSAALYDQFDSKSAMQTALSAAGAGYYATATASDGSVTVFYVTPGQGLRGKADLEPLEQFGFEVKSGPVA